jgi:F-type H+-transporting ATPase subunit b
MATTETPAATPTAPAESHGETHGSTMAEGGHEGGGLPQLDSSHYPSQLLWLAISFGLLYLLLSRVLLPKVESALARRRHHIEADLAGARQLQKQSEEVAAAYEAALAEARGKASGIAGDMRAKLTAEVDAERNRVDEAIVAKIAAGESDIADTRRKAMGEVEGITTAVVGDIVNRLIGRTPGPAEVKAAILAQREQGR